MAETLNFELVSPEKLVLSGAVKSVEVPGREGNFEILPEHAPMLSSLRPGVVVATMADGSKRRVYVRGGLAEVGPSNLTILAQQLADLDASEAAAACERELAVADDMLKSASTDEARFDAQCMVAALRD